MSHDLDTIVSDYQKIKASPHLATRINAHVKDSSQRKVSGWWPVLGAGAVVAVVGVMLITRVIEAPPEIPGTAMTAQSVPGFSQISGSPVTTASITSPSFSNLRSVHAPALPEKPVL